MHLLRDSQLLAGTINGARYERENRSEEYVEIPPAFLITDERGGMWTFGPEYEIHNGHYHFNVLRNDIDTGETAEKIIFRKGVVSIFGRSGWRRWNGRTFI
jgi:hypothetical protein